MGSFSDAVRTAWLAALTGGAAYANPDVWVQLHIGDPTSSGTANPAANTQRQLAAWDTATAGAVSNSSAVTWIDVPATETYTHISLWSLAAGGVALGTDQLAAPAPVTSGQAFSIAATALVLAVT